jgi:proteasome lid subunit RPN8/RPN11
VQRLILPEALRAAIIDHAQRGWPEEVCGLLAGHAGVATEWHPGVNVSPTPRVAYELDVDTLFKQVEFEEAGLSLVAIYHSHPQGPETPSATDIERAFYPEAVYLICSLAERHRPVLRGFRILDGRVTDVAIE